MVCWSLLSWFNSLRAIWEIYPTQKNTRRNIQMMIHVGVHEKQYIYIYMPPGWECHKTHDEVSGLMRKSKSSNRLQSHKETTHGPVSHKNDKFKSSQQKTNPHLKLWCLRDPPWQLSWHISYFPWPHGPDDPSRSIIRFKPQRSSYLVVHPTNHKWVITLVINRISGGKSWTSN